MAGERGAADAERDIRGFALKFYTEEGNWDIVGNNTPVFYFRDPLRFPDLNHAVKRDPRTGMRSAENKWDFLTLLPEALHQVTIDMSDRGMPAASATCTASAATPSASSTPKNERFWVKFHFKTPAGHREPDRCRSRGGRGKDRESNQRDLFYSIEKGTSRAGPSTSRSCRRRAAAAT